MRAMALKWAAKVTAGRRGWPFVLVVTAMLLRHFGAAAQALAQSLDPVRLSLVEVSLPIGSRSCTLEVTAGATVGEAILNCHRSVPPVSNLGAHRALTASEAASLYALAAGLVSTQPPKSGSAPRARVDRPTATLTAARGAQRIVLDVSDGPTALSPAEQRVWRRLRDLADELRR